MPIYKCASCKSTVSLNDNHCPSCGSKFLNDSKGNDFILYTETVYDGYPKGNRDIDKSLLNSLVRKFKKDGDAWVKTEKTAESGMSLEDYREFNQLPYTLVVSNKDLGDLIEPVKVPGLPSKGGIPYFYVVEEDDSTGENLYYYLYLGGA